MIQSAIIKDLVLIGGGHSHVLFIRMWAMQPMPGVRLTLVSEKVDTPYSGMLPGLIAGHYSADDVHIDLARLCAWAKVRFIERRLERVDLDAKQLHLNDSRPPVGFDVLSLDTGSTPDLSVSGSDRFSVPVKPVYGFYDRWLSMLDRMEFDQTSEKGQSKNSRQANSQQTVSVGVVGSGAGGYELVMAMRHALPLDAAECHWFVRGERALKGRPEKVSEMAMQAAMDAGVVIHKGFDVVDVKLNQLDARDGRVVSLDEIVWCAAAKAPSWPADAGFHVDKRGFVLTNAHLQSTSHQFVFATGDIGTQQNTPSTKAGVFAVRQAPVLFKNVRRYFLGTSLKVYKPQTDFLSLMATGGKKAIGNRGFMSVQGAWVWRWKNRIDQQFMNQFRQLPAMKANFAPFNIPQALLKNSSVRADEASNEIMRCRGCGGKVGSTILDSVLQELEVVQVPGVLEGLDVAGDAAVILTNGQTQNATWPNQLVQSVDQLSAVCDDPYAFGQIAAVHALSDVVSAGAIAHSAQIIVTLPFADQAIVKRDLQQLMAGVVAALNNEKCALIGGHTSEGAELSLGFVVNGFLRPELLAKPRAESHVNLSGSDADNRIVMTKPIGSGVLLAGMMRAQAAGKDVQAALGVMQLSNRAAADVLFDNDALGVTDITGFGLVGHLHRLLDRYNVGAQIQLSSIATYEGALSLAMQGIGSTLLEQNQQILQQVVNAERIDKPWQNLLCDPQTSGGLLGIVPAANVESVLAQLQERGCEQARVIGSVTESSGLLVNT